MALELAMWVIYAKPSDIPRPFVMRRYLITARGDVPDMAYVAADTLAEIRAHVPAGCVRMAPFPGDDPVIVEVWL